MVIKQLLIKRISPVADDRLSAAGNDRGDIYVRDNYKDSRLILILKLLNY